LCDAAEFGLHGGGDDHGGAGPGGDAGAEEDEVVAIAEGNVGGFKGAMVLAGGFGLAGERCLDAGQGG
jgi:hypothetical protein